MLLNYYWDDILLNYMSYLKFWAICLKYQKIYVLGLFVLQVRVLLKILPHVLQKAFKNQQGSQVQMFTKG